MEVLEQASNRGPHATTGASRLAVVLFVLAVLFALVVFALLGKVHPLPPDGLVVLDAPVSATTSGDRAAILHDDSRRVLVLDEQYRLRSIIDLGDPDSPIEVATDVGVADDGIVYVSGLTHAGDSDRIEDECVVAYRPDGSRIGVVYTPAQVSDRTPAVKSLSHAPGGVVGAVHAYDEDFGDRVEFVLIGLDGSRVVDGMGVGFDGSYDAGYSLAGAEGASISLRGVLGSDDYVFPSEYPDRVFTSVDVGDDGSVFLVDDVSGDVVRVDGDGLLTILDEGRHTSVHVVGETVVACDTDAGAVVFADRDGNPQRRLTSVVVSEILLARSVLFWAGCLYLTVLGVVLAIRWVVLSVRSGRSSNVAGMLGSVAVVASLSIAVLYLASQSYEDTVSTRRNEVGAFADYLGATCSSLSDAMEAGSDREAFRKGADELDGAMMGLAEVDYTFSSLAESAEDNGIGLYFAVYARDDSGVFHVYDSALEHTIGSNVIQGERLAALESVFDSGEVDTLMHEGRTLYDTTLYRFVGIPGADGEGLAGVVELGTRSRSLAAELGGLHAQRIIALLVMVIVVYLTYCELRSCGHNLLQYYALRESRQRDAVASLTRIFTFMISILQSIDMVMTVLIARSLLQRAQIADNTLLLAIPSVMVGVGLVAGQAIYSAAGPRTSTRALMAGGALGMAVCAIWCAAVVHMGSFALFCLAKLAMSVSFGLLYTVGYSLPRKAESADVGSAAAWDVTYTDVSASALGTVLGGYVAQMLGNAWVYVLVAFASMPLGLLALGLLPRKAGAHDMRVVEMSGRVALVGLLRTPSLWLVLVCMLLPLTLASGYNSFLFPLYSVDVGLRESDINNIFVLGQLAAYILVGAISRASDRFGTRGIVQVAVAVSGATLILLVVNGTFSWAVVAVAVISIMCIAGDSWQDVWMEGAAEAGVSQANAMAGMFAARSVVMTLQPAIMGALLLLGTVPMVTALGVFCLAGAAVSALASRRRGQGAALAG